MPGPACVTVRRPSPLTPSHILLQALTSPPLTLSQMRRWKPGKCPREGVCSQASPVDQQIRKEPLSWWALHANQSRSLGPQPRTLSISHLNSDWEGPRNTVCDNRVASGVVRWAGYHQSQFRERASGTSKAGLRRREATTHNPPLTLHPMWVRGREAPGHCPTPSLRDASTHHPRQDYSV